MIENQIDCKILRQTVHELRNIFCVIVGNLEMLRTFADDPVNLKMIDRAMTGVGRGDSVIATLDALTGSKSLNVRSNREISA